jgi:lipopolysaccharide transport system ATP-binding protein
VKDSISEIVKGESSDTLRKDEFWALDDVSFELRRGECLGLLGRNGAGKTTLLKVLSGLIKPDKGTIVLKGKVGGLIALGAGFNGILSGRENIRINGSILGYSREEIEERMQEIIDFAEIPDFIDAPVNTYSSGMSVRLGFAIAAILTKPDVLLLDEVLAVGDIGFTIKCLNAVREMMDNSAVIFVSHNMQFISQFCTSCLVLRKGIKDKPLMRTKEAINNYMEEICFDTVDVVDEEIQIKNINFFDKKDKSTIDNKEINQWSELYVNLEIHSKKDRKITFFAAINDNPHNHVIIYKDEKLIKLKEGINTMEFNLHSIDLNYGKYSFTFAINCSDTNQLIYRKDNCFPFNVVSDYIDWGNVVRQTKFKLLS